MKKMREGLERFVEIYPDSILILSDTRADHTQHIRPVLGRLREYRFFCKAEKRKRKKCRFFQDTPPYLGYEIRPKGLAMQNAKIQATIDLPAPTN